MPRVPQYRSQTSPIGANQLPSVRQTAAPTADQLGGSATVHDNGLGRGLMQAGNAAMQIAAAEAEHRALQEVIAADTLASQALNKYVTDARTKQGANVWGIGERAGADVDGILVKAREGLTSDFAREQFDARMAQRRVSAVGSVYQHEQTESQRYSAASLKASTVTAIQDAATNYADPAALADARKRLEKGLAGEAAYEGWPPEVAAVTRLERLSMMHTGVVQAMIANGSTQAAAQYLEKAGAELTADHRNRLTASLRTTKDTESAQSFADNVMAAGLSEADAIAKARKELSGDAEVRAVQEIKMRHAEMTQARERQQKSAADAAWSIVGRSMNMHMNDVPATVLQAMDGKDIMNMRTAIDNRLYQLAQRSAAHETRAAAAEARAEREAARLETAEAKAKGNAAYVSLVAEAANDPTAFVQRNLELDAADVAAASPSQFAGLMRMQQRVKAGAPQGERNSVTSAALKELGVKSGSTAATEFITAANEAFDQFEQANKRPPNAKELQVITDGLITKGTVPGMLWGSNETRAYKAGSKPFTPTVPDADKAAITEAFKRRGVTPTDDQILQAFKAAKGIR